MRENARRDHEKRHHSFDIPIDRLVPGCERKVDKKHYDRIEASLRAVGLVEPLVVCPQGDSFEILDGCLRYQILLELGERTVRCRIVEQLDDAA